MKLKDLKIHPVPALKDNYIWVIINTRHHSALVVDPGDAQPVLNYLSEEKLKLEAILITHHHWDHVNGVGELLKNYSVPVFGPKNSPFTEISHKVEDKSIITPNAHFPSFEVLSIPGHTLDHIAYYGANALFCGDTLFAAGCGRLFEGSAEQLYSSLQKLASLPENTQIYCAHEYTLNNLRFAHIIEPGNQKIIERIQQVEALRAQNKASLPSVLSEEKRTNPFLRCTNPEIIHELNSHNKGALNHPIEVFKALRLLKDHF